SPADRRAEFRLRRRVRLAFTVRQRRRAVQAEKALHQAGRLERGVVGRRAERLPRLVVQRPDAHRTSSSPFSGITASIAAIAASIILSSGSLTVSRWNHSPGAAMMRV